MTAKQIKAMREKKKMTQEKFAAFLTDKMGYKVATRTVQDWEGGQRAPNESAKILLNLVKSRMRP